MAVPLTFLLGMGLVAAPMIVCNLYLASLLIGAAYIVRNEFTWRKSAGLDSNPCAKIGRWMERKTTLCAGG
jgi:hypothetical protein